ncbi:MAG: hypothetical protein RL571_1246 [Pseudomonadota bacterium]|jgi:hypothetical protein
MSNVGDVATNTVDAYGLYLNLSASQSGLSGSPDGLTLLTQGVTLTGTVASFYIPGLSVGANLVAIE